MKEEKLGQEPAFPYDEYGYINEDMPCNLIESHNGMSKRFYAACQIAPSVISALLSSDKAIQGLNNVMKETNSSQEEVIVGMVYEYVDELLKQE